MRLLNCIKNIIKEERIGKLFGDIKVKVSIENSAHGNTQRFRHGKDEVITNDEILNILNLGLPEILNGIKEGELGQDSSIVVSQKDYPFLNVVTNLEEQDSGLQFSVADRFAFVEALSTMVATGKAPSAIITGEGGIGKTFTVTKTLRDLGLVANTDEGADQLPPSKVFTIVKGYSTPMALYRTLYENSDRIIVFDDCDSIMKENPDLFNRKVVIERFLKQIKVPGINELMIDVPAAEKRDAPNENVAMMLGQSAFAYMEQDHLSHIQTHLEFFKDPVFGMNPMVTPTILPRMMEHIKQHLSMWYLIRMNGYVTKSLGRQADDYDDPRITAQADKLMALASQNVTLDTQKVFAQTVPELQKMMQMMQQFKQSNTPPMTPEAQVLLQTSMAETQRLTAKDQADNQLNVQKLQNQQQLDTAKLGQSQQQFEAEQQLEVAMQTEKNLTQERIESARLTRDAAKLQQEQVKTATELQREAQTYLGG